MARTAIQALVFALLLTPSLAVAGDLTLRDVIELHRSGLGDDLLISVIDADGGPFTLTFADIHDLKSDGISERVITALVRTGARSPSMGGVGAAPVVQVRQEVINYVVPAVVLLDSPGTDRSPSGTDRTPRPSWARPGPPPPATWVTRQEDGKNVTAGGAVRIAVPAATWITPRDPQPQPRPQPK